MKTIDYVSIGAIRVMDEWFVSVSARCRGDEGPAEDVWNGYFQLADFSEPSDLARVVCGKVYDELR